MDTKAGRKWYADIGIIIFERLIYQIFQEEPRSRGMKNRIIRNERRIQRLSRQPRFRVHFRLTVKSEWQGHTGKQDDARIDEYDAYMASKIILKRNQTNTIKVLRSW